MEPAERESRRAPTGKTSTPTFKLGIACCLLCLLVCRCFSCSLSVCFSCVRLCFRIFFCWIVVVFRTSKFDPESIKNRSKIDLKSIKNRSKSGSGARWPKDANIEPPKAQTVEFFGGHVGVKLRPSCTQNPLRSCLNFRLRFGSSFGASWARVWSYFGRVSRSNLAPRKVSKLTRPMCTKLYYLQYETMVFNLPRGPKSKKKRHRNGFKIRSTFKRQKITKKSPT